MRSFACLSLCVSLVSVGCRSEFGVDDYTEPIVYDDGGCWFGVGSENVPSVDQDGDGTADHLGEVGVKTLPVFRLAGPDEVTISPGEDVTITVGARSFEECGDFELNCMRFMVSNRWNETNDWIPNVYEAGEPSHLVETTYPLDLGPNTPKPHDPSPTLDYVEYVWSDGSVQLFDANIDTQVVEADQEKIYAFTWTSSEFAPIGSDLRISLHEVYWTDGTTHEQIRSADPYFQAGDVFVEVR